MRRGAFERHLADRVLRIRVREQVITRTTNAEDSIFATENTAGYNAIAAVEMLGDSIEEGLVAYSGWRRSLLADRTGAESHA